jgi:hypothetical protein
MTAAEVAAVLRGMPPLARQSWFIYPLVIGLLILPAVILAVARAEDRAGLMLAYLNVTIIGIAMAYFVRRRTLHAILPVLHLTWLLFSWPLASIYFGVFAPEAGYVLIDETQRPYISGNARVQAVVLLFLLVYLPIVSVLGRWRTPVADYREPTPAGQVAALVAMAIAVFGLTFKALGQFMEKGSLPRYFADASFLYLNGVPLVVGALFPIVPLVLRVLFLAFLAGIGFLFLLANARGLAMLPIALFVFGLLFVSSMSQRWKTGVLAIVLVAFPVVLIAGETTRALLGRGGFEHLGHRLETMGRWQEVVGQQSVLGRTFARTIFIGGHSIITLTPDSMEYLEFDAPRYITEFLTRLFVPGRIYADHYYSSTTQLRRYKFLITEATSVELSFLGSLWLIGGVPPVVVGTALVALLHLLAGWWLRAAARASPYQGAFFLAMISYHTLWGHNLDLISHSRSLIWQMVFATLVWYLFVRPLLQPFSARPRWMTRLVAGRPAGPLRTRV